MERLSRDELGTTLELISEELRKIESIMIDASTGGTSFLTESTTYLTNAGGKRLRPALMVLAARLSPDGVTEEALKTSAAIEMTHLATLYHDDVIDEADSRRGVPSANEKWGNKVAILAGDFLFARSSWLTAGVGKDVPKILADAIAEVVEGQVLELGSTYDKYRTIDQYFRTIRGKTASLLEACTRLGAALGGAGERDIGSMKEFGSEFGYAFQVADDLLDLAATHEELGKPPGTDLRDGVYTLPVIFAAEKDPDLLDLLGDAEVDVDRVRTVVLETGGFQRARDVALDHVERALAALERMPESDAREALTQIARLVVARVPDLA